MNSNTPYHIAFIMDGNGRWAKSKGMRRSQGHKAGFEHIPDILEYCQELGVKVVSGYAWSTENWNRPPEEVRFIMKSLERELMRFVKELDKRNVRFFHSGSRERLSKKALTVIDEAMDLTRNNGPQTFNLAFNYGGRAEIVNVARRILAAKLNADSVCEEVVDEHLWTHGLPDVDLLVRTGFERRTSNFLLWQSAHAVLHFVDAFWPDVTKEHIKDAVKSYQRAHAQRNLAPPPTLTTIPAL
jgi:undecaprenyl diphosphate synthase